MREGNDAPVEPAGYHAPGLIRFALICVSVPREPQEKGQWDERPGPALAGMQASAGGLFALVITTSESASASFLLLLSHSFDPDL